MQAAIPSDRRLTMAAPFGRAAVASTDLVLSVAASSQAMLAEPRFVTRISPSSATAPAAPGNPGSVVIWRPASGSITSIVLRLVWAMKTRRLFVSKVPWSKALPAAPGISITPAVFNDMMTSCRCLSVRARLFRPCAIASEMPSVAQGLDGEAVWRGACASP